MRQTQNNVTLAIVSTERSELDFEAISRSAKEFDTDKVLILSDNDEGWKGLPILRIDTFTSTEDYNVFMLRDLHRHIETDFVLTIQYDGFVLDSRQFSPHFYHYDYIGAPWSWYPHFRVGNSGFAWRSRKLLEASSALVSQGGNIQEKLVDDLFVCRTHRVRLEDQYGINFAGEDLASHFSVEFGSRRYPTFGFHGAWHLPQVYSDRLSWLIENLPDRTFTNDIHYNHLHEEISRISRSHTEEAELRRSECLQGL